MSGWGLFWIGIGTAVVSAWYARPQQPLPPDASWWARSSRSYAGWKGGLAPVMIPIGLAIALVGLMIALTR